MKVGDRSIVSIFLVFFLCISCGKYKDLPEASSQSYSSVKNEEASGTSKTKSPSSTSKKEAEDPTSKADIDSEKNTQQKAVVRQEITNTKDKLTRAQADLSRQEQLRDRAAARRDESAKALAALPSPYTTMQTTNGTVVTVNPSIFRARKDLQDQITAQNTELAQLEGEIKMIEQSIADLEKQIDDLTLKV